MKILFIVGIISVIALIVLLFSLIKEQYLNWYLKIQKERADKEVKRIERKNQVLRNLKAQQKKYAQSVHPVNWNTLDLHQKKLIQLWLKEKMFEQHRDVFNTIIKDDKYNDDDKKTLSECRETHIKMKKYFVNNYKSKMVIKGFDDSNIIPQKASSVSDAFDDMFKIR